MTTETDLKEECGVFAVFNNDPEELDTARTMYAGLFALQHRGQESCGIAINDHKKITLDKRMGLVSEAFHEADLEALQGQMAIGHVRYAADGGTGILNAQPIVSHYTKGQIALAVNGNLSNFYEIKHYLEKKGTIFQSTTDAELILHLLAQARQETGRSELALAKIIPQLKGSYSLVLMSPQKLMACRDPKGMRPLSLGKIGNSYVIASETCALDTVRAEFVRDIDPGEVVIIDKDGVRSIRDNVQPREQAKMCIFEHVYFARPDSVIEGMSVHEARKMTGRILAQEFPVDADLVIGVPDSGIDAAIGYAQESGIQYGKGLVINRYVGRTFIQPTQAQRKRAVRLKINVLRDTVKGKRIVMVDDSIVRGTTCANLVDMLKEAGATEVHMRISSPPFTWPCYFGTDVPSKDKLIACQYSTEEIRKMIGADSLGFFPVERLKEIVPDMRCGFCDGCFTGNYPYDYEDIAKEGNANAR